jgi:8-oxo-dGTP pyrophosphatase MutT (NUDIX family)
MYKYKLMICLNCDKPGHTFRSCSRPIRSYGFIAYKKTKNGNSFLLIRRKYTIGFTDFLRGKYKTFNKTDMGKIKIMVGEMTNKEKHQISTESFDQLWGDLWINHERGIYVNEYRRAKIMFKNIDIRSIIKSSGVSKYNEPEYGFPKGRKNINETAVECAKREFEEETGLRNDDYKISVFSSPIVENFIGSDNVKYSHYYYFAEITKDLDFEEIINEYQDEVSIVGLYDLKNAYNLIRDYDVQKKYTLLNADDIIKKMR